MLEDEEEYFEESSLSYRLTRYFAQGLAFSFLGVMILLFFPVLMGGLFAVGAFIGLIIGFIILFFVYGVVNSFLVERIWNVQIDWNWKKLLAQGFVLFIALIAVSIPSVVVDLIWPSVSTAVIVFVVYCFVDGYVGKVVGSHWEGTADLDRTDEDS